MVDHDALIDTLSQSLPPVKRPAATGVRAAVWVVLALAAGTLATQLMRTRPTEWSHPGALWAALELGLSFGVGSLAIVKAFNLSIAGRKTAGWRTFLPLMGAWLAAGLAGIVYPSGLTWPPVWHRGSGAYCYSFMLLAALPMMGLAILAIRRTRTLYPVRSLGLAGLGIAFMTMTLLSMCHSVGGDLPDYIMHMVAAATIVVLTVVVGRPWVAIRNR